MIKDGSNGCIGCRHAADNKVIRGRNGLYHNEVCRSCTHFHPGFKEERECFQGDDANGDEQENRA
jgi:hypothetical protein